MTEMTLRPTRACIVPWAPRWATMALMENIGRYRIVRRLGSGTFATVWLGHDDELDIDVAVKVLAENWIDNDDVRDRFIAEARHMRRIRDTRVVRVYDIGETDDHRPYFVMDYCDAGSLADLRTNPIAPASALRLCAEACLALDVIHRHNVIHRDVTPGNLLLDRTADGALNVQLADLGVAKSMLEDQQQTMTAGTPAFMAPEQASGAPMDPRADVYAMACVIYAVLTSKPPFPVKSLGDLLARSPQERPEPLATRLGTPPELDDLLTAALSLDPNQRPATAAMMAAELDRIVALMPPDEGSIPTRVRARDTGVQLPGQYPAYAPSPQTWPPQGTMAPGQPMTPAQMSMVQQQWAQAQGPKRYYGYTAPQWVLITASTLVLFFGTLFLTLKLLGR